jgi:hypothetical protein
MTLYVRPFCNTTPETNRSVNNFITNRISDPTYPGTDTSNNERLFVTQQQQAFAEGTVLQANPGGILTSDVAAEVLKTSGNYYLMHFANSALSDNEAAGIHTHPYGDPESNKEINRRLVIFPTFDATAEVGAGSGFFILSKEPITTKDTLGKPFTITDDEATLYVYEVPNGLAVEVSIEKGTTHQFIHYDSRKTLPNSSQPPSVVATSYHPFEYKELQQLKNEQGTMAGQTTFVEGAEATDNPSVDGIILITERIHAIHAAQSRI